jgi:NAD(P)-dependent dehydrogenase (short-subunit alcohol dehydrogenase family)
MTQTRPVALITGASSGIGAATALLAAERGYDVAFRVSPLVPMKRAGEPEEIAKTILWLASEDASYITGTLMDVTGGR